MSESDKYSWSLKNGDLQALKELVSKKGRDINSTINGRSLLHHAADYGHKKVIIYLVENGADVNNPDMYNITPLLAAVYEGHRDCVEYLVAQGADKTGMAPDGRAYIDCTDDDSIKQLLK